MESHLLTTNASSLRYVDVNGRQFAIAPITILEPKVLEGSKGALYYPPEEIAKNPDDWNGKPLTVRHPKRNGANVSAFAPDIFVNQEIGRFYNSKINKDGSNSGEGWFDVEMTKKLHSELWNRLEKGEKIEVSTGLYTDNEEAPANSQHDGKVYTHIAKNYRANHIAILPDEIGACSIKDGCGVFNNHQGAINNDPTINPKWVKDHGTWEKAKEQASKEGHSEDYGYITEIYKKMGGTINQETDDSEDDKITCAYCGMIQDNPDDGICPNCDKTINYIPNTKDAIMNRQVIIDWLTTNCACYKSVENKKKLEQLNDAALKEILIENAEKGAEVDADQSFLEWIGNADKEIKNAFVSMIRKKLKGAVGSNEFPAKKEEKPAATAPSPEEEMKKKMMEEEANKATANNSAKNQGLTIADIQKAIFEHPTFKNMIANHNQNENTEKQKLIGQITATITDNNYKAQVTNSLSSKSLDDLRLIASLTPQQTNTQQFSPVANYFGASGGPVEPTDNSYLQQEKLVVNEIDWAAWSKEQSKVA